MGWLRVPLSIECGEWCSDNPFNSGQVRKYSDCYSTSARVFILLFFSWKYTAEVSFEDAYHVLSCGTTSMWHGARTLERIIKSRGLWKQNGETMKNSSNLERQTGNCFFWDERSCVKILVPSSLCPKRQGGNSLLCSQCKTPSHLIPHSKNYQ